MKSELSPFTRRKRKPFSLRKKQIQFVYLGFDKKDANISPFSEENFSVSSKQRQSSLSMHNEQPLHTCSFFFYSLFILEY